MGAGLNASEGSGSGRDHAGCEDLRGMCASHAGTGGGSRLERASRRQRLVLSRVPRLDYTAVLASMKEGGATKALDPLLLTRS